MSFYFLKESMFPQNKLFAVLFQGKNKCLPSGDKNGAIGSGKLVWLKKNYPERRDGEGFGFVEGVEGTGENSGPPLLTHIQ